jgi:glycosyltransferase involved in cell wall biosynthesis
MRVPEGLDWELVVVDNGSSDGTADVVRSFGDRLPVRVAREDAAGLANARNRGVAEARGRYICWTDDDVLIDEGWLAAYAAAFERHPDAVVFGGRITPVLESPTPAWCAGLAETWPLTTVLAKRDYGDQPIPLELDEGIVPWGANYAVRTAEQRQIPYEPGLGVSPLHKRVGEEAEVIFQMLGAGRSGWWAPDAQVRHMIPPKRQTLSYVFEFFASHGETVRYLESLRPGRHHKAGDTRDIERTRGGPLRLYAMAGLNWTLFALSWLVGARRRGLCFLARAGFYKGAAQFAAGEAST